VVVASRTREYREQADRLRRLSTELQDPELREETRHLSLYYDRLADQAERESTR
jgi:hypothetical protein